MASPLKTGKASIDLAAKGAPGSRIRRDPPPTAKTTLVPERDELDRQRVAIGIVAFVLAVAVILIGFASFAGWSPRQYTIHIRASE